MLIFIPLLRLCRPLKKKVKPERADIHFPIYIYISFVSPLLLLGRETDLLRFKQEGYRRTFTSNFLSTDLQKGISSHSQLETQSTSHRLVSILTFSTKMRIGTKLYRLSLTLFFYLERGKRLISIKTKLGALFPRKIDYFTSNVMLNDIILER